MIDIHPDFPFREIVTGWQSRRKQRALWQWFNVFQPGGRFIRPTLEIPLQHGILALVSFKTHIDAIIALCKQPRIYEKRNLLIGVFKKIGAVLTSLRINIILKTLDHHEPIDFWWLNNGITIISTGVIIVGKTMTIQNVQIVNGLQTSECIYRYFSSREIDDDRNVLIKVLTSQDKSICDCIIRATNNQTEVQAASLHATDKIQRDIEDILLHYGNSSTLVNTSQHLSTDTGKTPHICSEGHGKGLKTGCSDR